MAKKVKLQDKQTKHLLTLVNQRLLQLGREGVNVKQIESSDLFVITTQYLLEENKYHGYNYYMFDANGILRLAGEETNIIQFEVR